MVRHLAALAFLLVSPQAFGLASAQTYEQATVEAHLRDLYEFHGERLFKWQRPIYYIVGGHIDGATKQIVHECFVYLRDLTGLAIEEADPTEQKGNFILAFGNPLPQLATMKAVRDIFGKEGQSEADFHEMLNRLEKDSVTRQITKRSGDAILSVAVLTNSSVWDDELFRANMLKLIVQGLTETGASDRIVPSVWNSAGKMSPMSRLPSLDEAFIRNLYRGGVRSGMPKAEAIRVLAAAITFDLNN